MNFDNFLAKSGAYLLFTRLRLCLSSIDNFTCSSSDGWTLQNLP